MKNKNFCLEYVNKSLRLKRNHDYFYQCQILMFVWEFEWIDFVIRSLNPYQIFVERIHIDKSVIDYAIIKMQAFYFKALLPELASPRRNLVPGIRECGVWVSIIMT